jgi:hypothetical protein
MTIAQTILAQLNGNKFIAMAGAKHLADLGNGLQFKLPANFAARGINFVSIKLNAMDLYDVTFGKLHGINLATVEARENVYGEDLRNLFTTTTGLNVSL